VPGRKRRAVTGGIWLDGRDQRLATALRQALAAEGIAMAGSAAAAAAVVWLAPAVDAAPVTQVPHLALVAVGEPVPSGVSSLNLPVRLPALLDWVRRALAAPDFAGWRLDHATRRFIHATGSALKLTELEARLLAALLDGALHPPAALLAAGWPGRSVLPATLATHIHRLRAKLDAASGPVLLSRARDGYQLLARAPGAV
jgi:hypothetical protein